MPDVTSAAGDCFNRIAKNNGFFNYLTVYNYDDNAANFPNPNQLVLGSTVKVPDKRMKAFDVKLDAETKFKIIREKCKLRVKVCKADLSAATTSSVQLTIGAKSSKAANSGLLEIADIDANETAATLVVKLADLPAYQKAPPTPAAVANQYPPRVVPEDFDDPATVWVRKGETVTWNLEVGSLEPHTVTRGVLQRLHNLGFSCPIQTAEDDDTRVAVRTYRRAVENLDPPGDTSAVADIQDNIKGRHDD